MIAGACLLASATAAPSEAEMDSLLRKTLAGVAKIIAEEFGKIGFPAVAAEQVQRQAKFSYLEEEEFNKRKIHGETTWKYMYYDGNEPARVKVNKTAVAALLEHPARDADVEAGARKLVEEAALVSGEARANATYDGIKEYWYYGRSRSASHLFDRQERCNPEALLGLYALHVVDRRLLSREQKFHDFLKQKATAEPAYKRYVEDIVAHYPEEGAGLDDNKGLFAMLRYENQRIQIWMLALDAVAEAVEKKSTVHHKVKETIDLTNQHIRTTLAQSPLEHKQKVYINAKYAIDKTLATVIKSYKPNANVDEKLVEQLGFEKTLSAEEGAESLRQAKFAAARNAYLQYYALQDNAKVWKEGDSVCHEELEALLKYVLPESIRLLDEWVTEYHRITKLVVDKASADKYADLLNQQMLILEQLASNILCIFDAYGEGCGWLLYDRESVMVMKNTHYLLNESANHQLQWHNHNAPLWFGSEKLRNHFDSHSEKGSIQRLYLSYAALILMHR